jgi:predicted phosphodiesterase
MTAVTRVAFVSDIHGNLPALEAVLEELARREPFDRVVGGGDYATGGLFPKECIDRVRDRDWDFVRGNADEWLVEIATEGEIPAEGWVPEVAPDEKSKEVMRWNVEYLDPDSVSFLAGLPIEWSVSGPSGQKLVFVHATPDSTHTHLGYPPDASEDIFLPMFEQTGADVLLHGHIHHAYVRTIGELTLGCVGSVGLPFDRDARACFAIATDDGTGWRVEHIRVPYDREAYLTGVMESTMPNADEYAAKVRSAER